MADEKSKRCRNERSQKSEKAPKTGLNNKKTRKIEENRENIWWNRIKPLPLQPQNNKNALVAQLVEHLTLNQGVQGSTPCRRTEEGNIRKSVASFVFAKWCVNQSKPAFYRQICKIPISFTLKTCKIPIFHTVLFLLWSTYINA